MPLQRKVAEEAVRAILGNAYAVEYPRLAAIHDAMVPTRTVAQLGFQIPEDAPGAMTALAAKAQTNYMPLIVDTFGQVMKVEGYYHRQSDTLLDPWVQWQRNRMNARQTGLHRAALQYGVSYAMVLPGIDSGGRPGPQIRCYSPRRLTALYQDESVDEWPMLALLIDDRHVRLVDETSVYTFGVRDNRPIWQWDVPTLTSPMYRLDFIERQDHNLGFTPIVRYRDRQLLSGEEQLGIVEPLLAIQSRLDETTYEMLVAQYFAAFKQRYVLGWIPKSEQEELKAGAARIWYLDKDPADVKIGELGETDITRYIESKRSALRDMAAIGQLPGTAVGVDAISNISAEALAALESSKDRKVDELSTSLGESHEQLLRLCAYISGDVEAADDYLAEIRWKDTTAKSFGQLVDGLGKLVTMLGYPPEIALEDLPGMTDAKLARVLRAMQQQPAQQDPPADPAAPQPSADTIPPSA